ncbi:MAG TPA: endonuclease III [Candidatus Binataceae bacterium]|nr:endonuclease III [Candidatus Binataceae bacterium]
MAAKETAAQKKQRALRLAARLEQSYPQARISLDFHDAWQCLVATILSAQCTDERVNRVTPELFARLPDPRATAAAPAELIERMIASTGFFRQKTKALQGVARALLERFDGQVPDTMEELVSLPGVGRKTANVILGHIFGKPGLVVDTHVRRLSYRLGLSVQRDPGKIEQDLQALLPPAQWTAFSMRLILHGRRICVAQRPRCELCPLEPDCPRVGVPVKTRPGGKRQVG